MKTMQSAAVAFAALLSGVAAAGEWKAQLTDPLEWLYPDSKVGSVAAFAEADVPVNGVAEVNVLVNGLDPGKPVEVSSGRFGGKWFRLVDVPVEKNTSIEDWCERPKERKNPYVTRRAPFRVFDAMEPFSGKLEKAGSATCAFTWNVNALRLPPRESLKIVFRVTQGGVTNELPFTLRVHPVQLPEPHQSKFRYTNWMRIGSIGADHGLRDWSKEYYDMLGSYCHLAVRGRQNVAWIPLWAFLERNGETGRYDVCEERFREIVRVYDDCNIRWIEGGHICAAGWDSTNVTVVSTGRAAASAEGKRDIAEICGEIMRLVRKYRLEKRWIQHVGDEPTKLNAGLYRLACDEVRRNMPGIPLVDAVCTPNLGDSLDIYVPNVNVWQPNRKTYDDLAAQGKEIWTYVCLTPGGKWMNRLMDGELIRPALIPWADSLFGVRGFLHWGYNFFNPGQEGGFKFSCYQAGGKGNTSPAGDNHLVYAGKDGPWPSRRFEATRQGIEDYEMLEEIRRKDPSKADAIIRRMVTGFDDYRTDLVLYRKLRREILENAVKSDFPHTCLKTERQPLPKAVAADALGVWTADSMRRVTPMTFPTAAELAAPAIELSVARNERESAQICLTAGAAKEWKGVTVELPVLKDAEGRALDGGVTWERVGYIPRMPGHLPHWEAVDVEGKWIPDPLLPAAPMRVRAGSTQGAWLTFYASSAAKSGLYSGTATVVAEGRRIPVALRLRVTNASLPKTFSTLNSFSLMDCFLKEKYPERLKEMRRAAEDVMLDNRLSPDNISRTVPPETDELLHARERGMNRFNLLNVAPASGDRLTLVAEEKDISSDAFRKTFLGRIDAAMAELKRHGLDKLAYIYGFDEREKEYNPAMDALWRAVRAKYPDLPLMTTCRGFRDKVANPKDPPPFWDSCDWFCPVTSDWNADLAAELQKSGKKVWWYTCCGPDHPYANFASYENPPIEGRILLGYMTPLYRADGFLFWLVNKWFEQNPLLDESDTYFPDWNTRGVMRCNGDGVLLYPGKDHILSSIRLANIRDGVEDGELVRAVAASGREAADGCCRELVTDLKHFSRDPAAVRAVREKLLRLAGVCL